MVVAGKFIKPRNNYLNITDQNEHFPVIRICPPPPALCTCAGFSWFLCGALSLLTSSNLLHAVPRHGHASVDVARLHEEVIHAPEEEEPGNTEGD